MVIEIKGYRILIDDDMAPAILARKWHVSRRNYGVYFATTVWTFNGKSYEVRLHRIIAEAPPGVLVDHRNGNTFDNRRENLRWCTDSQNAQNRSDSHSGIVGYRGVTIAGKKFRAKITVGKQIIHIGCFDTPEEASEAYETKAKELFGEFYREEAA
jgi:hypothetical protein